MRKQALFGAVAILVASASTARADHEPVGEGLTPATTPAPAPDPAPPPKPTATAAASTKPAAASSGERESAPVEEVVISGTRSSRMAGAVHVVGKEQLDRYQHDDPHAVFAQVPGVYVRAEDGFGLRPNVGMRGVNSDRTKKVTLLEDGVLFAPAAYSAPAAYAFPLITRMQSVRVVKGPGAILYGPHTVGGTIDLITASIPAKPTGTADLAYGSYAYRKLHLTYGSSDERTGFLVEGVHLGSDGFKELDGDSSGDTGFTRNEWMVKTRFVPDPSARTSNEFELKASYSDEGSNETYLGLTDADLRATPYRRYRASALDRFDSTRTAFALTHRTRPARDVEMVTTAYRQDFHRIWSRAKGLRGASFEDVLANPDAPTNAVYHGVLTGRVDATSPGEALLIGPNDRTFVSQGVQTALRAAPRTGPIVHKAEMGLRLHYDSIARKHSQSAFRMTGGQLVPEGSPPVMTADNTASTSAISLHVMDAMTWSRLTVTPGVRFESIFSRNRDRVANLTGAAYELAVLPGAGGFVALAPNFGLLGGVYRGFSPAPPGDRTANPETSINYEAGARYMGKRARMELIGWYNDYQNVTSICTFSSGCLSENIDKQLEGGAARVYGIEAYAETAPEVSPGLKLPLRASYALTFSEFLQDIRSRDPVWGRVRSGDEMPYVPRHQAYASVGAETERWGANASLTYMSPLRERPGQGEAAPAEITDASVLVDAMASYRPERWLKLYVGASNLLNRAQLMSRLPFGARSAAPLIVRAGLKAEF